MLQINSNTVKIAFSERILRHDFDLKYKMLTFEIRTQQYLVRLFAFVVENPIPYLIDPAVHERNTL